MQLDTPREGLPPIASTDTALVELARSLELGSGPIALDAERAGGIRYDHRAYLVQIRRSGSGTHLIDPTTISSFEPLQNVLSEPEWILHSASQDLPCLAELGLVPSSVFDTEMAARIAGRPRVGLAALIEQDFDFELAKQYGAADWSARPLPESWLNYAALDVELLIELRENLEQELENLGRLDWAHQEFEHIRTLPPKPTPDEPWRSTKYINRARTPRDLAVVRELWEAREAIAQREDRARAKIMHDESILEIAIAKPKSRVELKGIGRIRNSRASAYLDVWVNAVKNALSIPEAQLPQKAASERGLPRPRVWIEKFPDAAVRLEQARNSLSEISESTGIPVENLLLAESVRQLCWDPPENASVPDVEAHFASFGARAWQVELCSERMWQALTAPVEDIPPDREAAEDLKDED